MRLEIYLRGQVWWVRGYDSGTKIRRSTKERSEGRAKRIRDRWEREYLDPTHFRADKATVASAAERWMSEIRVEMNPETVRFYDAKIRHVVRLLGPTKLSRVTHEKVLAYIKTRTAEGSHPHSLHRELTALRLTLRSAKRAREFAGDPRDVIPRFKAGYEPLKNWVTAETVWAAIAHLMPGRGAAVAYVIATACDYSNIEAARLDDVQPEFIRVRGTKTGTRDRSVPRIEVMEPFLRHAVAYSTGKAPLLFEPWTNMPRDVRLACRKAGVPEFTARTLRRSAATWMVQAGVPYEVAAKFLGHGSTAMLQKVYGQLPPPDAARLINERLR
jgi:integrase